MFFQQFSELHYTYRHIIDAHPETYPIDRPFRFSGGRGICGGVLRVRPAKHPHIPPPSQKFPENQSIGVVQSVVWGRLVGLLLFLILPLMPVYYLAALIYLLRSAFIRGTAEARQALTIGLVREQRHGLATSLKLMTATLNAHHN